MVKLIAFSPKCSEEFDNIINTSGRSIEGLFHRLKDVRVWLFGGFMFTIGITLVFFILFALLKKEFQQNYKSKVVDFIYYATFIFYIPSIIFSLYLTWKLSEMMYMMLDVHKKSCASPASAGVYFKKTANEN